MASGPRIQLTWLEPGCPVDSFPAPEQALDEPNGLLAVGGDLSPARLLTAYRKGIFPWFNPGEPIFWWSPDPRMLLPLGSLHKSRSLRRRRRRCGFHFSINQNFSGVMRGCARDATLGGTWLGPQMQAAYQALHEQGYAHSLEVWDGADLVGGIYGVAMGSLFFGESMFSRADDASKLALWALEDSLLAQGFCWLDAQLESEHLYSLGFQALPRSGFLELISGLTNANQPHRSTVELADAWATTAGED